jgi:hypothetical protein
MAPLDFLTDSSFECVDVDSKDHTFLHALSLIGDRDTVEEYLACEMFPLSASFGGNSAPA